MSKYVLLTGATGLVGRYLVRGLLLDDHRLAILIRPSDSQNIFERLESILRPWERKLGVRCHAPSALRDCLRTGTGTGCGFSSLGSSPLRSDLAQRSSADLLPGRIVKGSHGERILTALAICSIFLGRRIRNFALRSTSYVCGTRPGVILEDELDCGQGFRND